MTDDFKQKIVEAFIKNQKGELEPDSLWFRWEPAHESFKCPRCNGALERTAGAIICGPYAGSVRCGACDYRSSVMRYLVEQAFKVEPLPPGALPIYDMQPDDPDTK